LGYRRWKETPLFTEGLLLVLSLLICTDRGAAGACRGGRHIETGRGGTPHRGRVLMAEERKCPLGETGKMDI
jgi:hypothetical protein